jgi:hypothetical protein
MTDALIAESPRMQGILDRLSSMSIEDYYNPYKMFEWPDTLPEQMWWMSPELTTTYGTEVAEELTQEQLYALSKYESVNFYSLNVHGIRELLIEVTHRIHTDDFTRCSEFFHHFIGEENEHMWFFAEFCQRYGKKIYKQLRGGAETVPPGNAASLLVFARILIFEELVDHFNLRMSADERLHETIRGINRIHHQDESRHIAFGRELVKALFESFRSRATPEELEQVSNYLKRYLTYSFETLYTPQVYKDAGIAKPLDVRRRLLEGPRRRELEAQVFRKTLPYLTRLGIVQDGPAAAAEAAAR